MSDSLARVLEENAEFVQRVRERHPERRSECGALLTEILHGENWDDRARAAHSFGNKRYRRGMRQLTRLIYQLDQQLSQMADEVSPERRLLGNILIALGWMETADAHAVLSDLIRNSTVPWVRADALEATAWEREHFELKLVLPFVSFEAHNSEILSALYALQFHDYVNKHPRKCRTLIAPFLAHPYSMVRVFAIELLAYCNSRNRDLIAPLVHDPDVQVQQEARNAMRQMDESEGRLVRLRTVD